MTDFDQVKKLASLPTRVVPLCLAGEIVEEIAELEAKLEATPAPTNLGDGSRRELAEQIVAAQERMRESTVDFHLKALPAKAWGEFCATQPMREEKEAYWAWRTRTFPWWVEMVSRTATDPAMSPAQATELADLLGGGQFEALADACLELNGGKLDVPNSAAASALIGNSEQT